MAQLPTAASRFGLPPGSVERVEKRTVDAKHFQLPDGSFAAIIGAGPLHYHAPDGSLQDLDLTFHSSGADQVVDRLDGVRVRIPGGGNGIEVTDPAGNGVRWLTAQHPAVTANLAHYTDAQSEQARNSRLDPRGSRLVSARRYAQPGSREIEGDAVVCVKKRRARRAAKAAEISKQRRGVFALLPPRHIDSFVGRAPIYARFGVRPGE